MSKIFRRQWLQAAFLGASLTLMGSAIAQSYPSKPIRILTGFAPGAPGEIVMRLVADKVFASSKQAVVIDNRPGANGDIGIAQDSGSKRLNYLEWKCVWGRGIRKFQIA